MKDTIDLFSLDDEIWNMLRRLKGRTSLDGSNPLYMMILQDKELVAVSSQPMTTEEVNKELARHNFSND